MNRKKTYTAPHTEIVRIEPAENLAQFVVSSHSVGEDEGLAKPGDFFDEDEDAGDCWNENPTGNLLKTAGNAKFQ